MKSKLDIIQEVILRIDFDISDETKLIEKLEPEIKKQFPKIDHKIVKISDISMDTKTNQTNQKISEIDEYQYSNGDYKLYITKSPAPYNFSKLLNSIVINGRLKNYNYSKLRAKIKPILEKLISEYTNIKIARIGLRRLYTISGDKDDLTKKINLNLTFKFNKLEDKYLSRKFGNITYNYDNYNLTFNFGEYNKDFPSKIISHEFILDYDVYIQNYSINEKIIATIDEFNNKIDETYQKSIK